jgi:LmbE family N-acetylglucosaminyl deacetylase
MKPLVCIFAHPDDEAFGPAGSIAKFAKERDIYLICITDGNAGNNSQKENGKTLGQIRKEELEQSAKILGIKRAYFLNYPDGTLSNNLYHEIAEKIEKILTELKPDTILTFEPHGISGHIDHITTSLVSTFVFKKLEFIKKLLYYAELEEMMKEIPSYFIYVPPGYKKHELDLTIDITEFWEIKLKAMQSHKSQKEDYEFVLNIISKFSKEEHFLKLTK